MVKVNTMFARNVVLSPTKDVDPETDILITAENQLILLYSDKTGTKAVSGVVPFQQVLFLGMIMYTQVIKMSNQM